jgi:hypothetical protein
MALNTYEHQPLDEDSIQRYSFDLLMAFDEVISFGHKEHVTLQQVKTYTEMDSHEEKLHKMIIQSKINDTKDVMKKKASEIDKSKVPHPGPILSTSQSLHLYSTRLFVGADYLFIKCAGGKDAGGRRRWWKELPWPGLHQLVRGIGRVHE